MATTPRPAGTTTRPSPGRSASRRVRPLAHVLRVRETDQWTPDIWDGAERVEPPEAVQPVPTLLLRTPTANRAPMLGEVPRARGEDPHRALPRDTSDAYRAYQRELMAKRRRGGVHRNES